MFGDDDRVRGALVHPHEYQDFQAMMENTGLYACQTLEEYFTWSNKHSDGLIYAHVIRNVNWFQQYVRCLIEVLTSHISDHCPIQIKMEAPKQIRSLNS